jgi:phosphonate transport system permease protein
MEGVQTKQTIAGAKPALRSRSTFREELLNPYPRIGPRSILTAAIIAVMYVWGFQGARVSLAELIQGIPNIINFVLRLFPPQYTLIELKVGLPDLVVTWLGAEAVLFVPEIVSAIIETVQMAIVGTTFAVFLSLPFGLLAARNLSPHPLVYQATRMIMNIIRAIPELIFALIFVAAVGLGPFGGVLALAVGSIGFLGKLYAESIEAIDPQQVLALRATGAERLHVFRYGVIPQALPLMASYSLYLFESNVRHATILGMVGAGGVGFVIAKYMALFQYRKLMGAIILIVLTVTVLDRISDRLRKRFT